MRLPLALALCVCPLLAHSASLTADFGIIDVKRAPYSARGDGITDDTAAIQRALSDCIARKQTVYLPAGTYLVSDSLKWQRSVDLKWAGQCSIEGESQASTTLRLRDGARGFESAATPRGLLTFSSSMLGSPQPGTNPGGNEAFLNSARDLTIDTGNNAGAIGIDWVCSNRGTIESVTVRGSGAFGIDSSRIYPGPCLVHNVRIDGFAVGYRQGQRQFSNVLSDVRITRHTIAAVLLDAGGVTLHNLVTSGVGPAIRVTSAVGFLTVLGLHATGSNPPIDSAIEAGGRLLLRDVVATGYGFAYRRSMDFRLRSPIEEYVSAPPLHLFPLPETMPPIAFERAPEPYRDAPPCKPAVVSLADSIDDQPAIQAALNRPECAIVRVPHTAPGGQASQIALSRPLVIPCHVRVLDGLDNFVVPALSGYTTGQPMIQVTEDCHVPLTLTRLWKAGAPTIGAHFIDHRSSRDLVVRDVQAGGRDPGIGTHPGAGKLWMHDYSGTFDLDGTTAFGLQLNPEFPSPTPGNTMTDATLVAYGLKTEQDATVLRAVRSRVELLGLWLMPFGTPPPSPQFVIVDSELVFSGVTTWTDASKDKGAPLVVVRETRGQETRELTDVPGAVPRTIDGEAVAGGTRRWVPLFVAR